MTTRSEQFSDIYQQLLCHFGPQGWWPAETPFEVAVGAILTQNTAWRNVEIATKNLKQAGILDPRGLCSMPRARLEQLIRPSGFYRQKALRLQHFSCLLTEQYAGEMAELCAGVLTTARNRLLAIPGIGPETADSILLYAGQRPTFVVGAYTRRILHRLGLQDETERYENIRADFMCALPTETALFNEYHALVVTLAKNNCTKRQPLCSSCPLLKICPTGQGNVITPESDY
jgi:endonuclease-3 related protein